MIRQITHAFCWVAFRWRCAWWNNANVVEVLARDGIISGTRPYTEIRALHTAYAHFMTNKYFDDCGWFVLSWLKVYEWSDNDHQFLKTAETMMAHMNTGWDACSGGMFWTTSRNHKNAITNSLYMLANARLYLHTQHQPYLDRALAAWDWFHTKSGMFSLSSKVIQDSAGDTRAWTYNYGVLIGGLLELSKYRPELKDVAFSIAKEAIQQFSVDGILTEHGENTGWNGNTDRIQFKGIFMRYLGDLNEQVNDSDIAQFIRVNANAVLAIAAKYGTIGTSWHFSDYTVPPKFNIIAATSAADCIISRNKLGAEMCNSNRQE